MDKDDQDDMDDFEFGDNEEGVGYRYVFCAHDCIVPYQINSRSTPYLNDWVGVFDACPGGKNRTYSIAVSPLDSASILLN